MFDSTLQEDLCQGDICELDVFPHWNFGTALTVSRGSGATDLQLPAMPKVLPSKLHPERSLAVVCSYDCDFENPRGRTGLLIAPVLALSEKNARYDLIVRSPYLQTNDDGQKYFNYLQYFPLEIGHVTCVNTVMGVVDFSAITSFGKATDAVPLLKERKLHKLANDQRIAFRATLTTFMGRRKLINAVRWAYRQDKEPVSGAAVSGVGTICPCP